MPSCWRCGARTGRCCAPEVPELEPGPLIAQFVDLGHRVAQLGQPFVGVLADQLYDHPADWDVVDATIRVAEITPDGALDLDALRAAMTAEVCPATV